MADSDVDVNTDNLDEFSKTFFNPNAEVKTGPEDEEVPETPSATDDDSNESENEEESKPEEGEDAGDDAPEAEAEEPEEEEEAPKPKGRKPAAQRIKELTTKAYEADRRADALARELEALKSQSPVNKPVRQATLDADAPHPDETLEDGQLKYPLGEFDPIYIRDLTRHTIHQENEANKKQMEEDRQLEEINRAERQLLDSWTEKVKTVAERLPDLPEKVTELESTFTNLDPNYGKYLSATIMSLEYGPDVLDYLADHPDEAKRIVDSGATRATIALGRLEARFASQENEVEKGKIVPTKAPPPPPKNRGSGGVTKVAADTDDLDAFEKQFFSKR